MGHTKNVSTEQNATTEPMTRRHFMGLAAAVSGAGAIGPGDQNMVGWTDMAIDPMGIVW
jgi:hypothetical protein